MYKINSRDIDKLNDCSMLEDSFNLKGKNY